MEKYLVTGGAGFIGSNITKKLLEKGEFVRVVDDFSAGRKENIEEFINNSNFELIKGDLIDFAIARNAVEGMDFVLHQAAVSSVFSSVEDPLKSNNSNINATLNLLISAKDEGIKKFVFASSSSIYGDTLKMPEKENFPVEPISPYALQKYAGERYCQLFWQIYKFPAICLRYFNVFGPKQNPFSQYSAVIPKFITAFLKNEKPIIFGSGLQRRDFVYVDDVVEANLLAAESKNTNGEVFNIAGGEEIDLNQLIGLLQKITGKNIAPQYQEKRPGDPLRSLADISKARNVLGYNPKVGFEDGLIRTLNWYEKNGQA